MCGFCTQNSAFWIRFTSTYGSQPSSVVFAFKTTTFGSVLQISMGPRLRPLICECKTVCLDPDWQLSIGPILHLWFSAFKTTSLASEILVYLGPRLRLLICECKTACLDPKWRLSVGPSRHLCFSSFKTATLAPELLVYMGPSPHLFLLNAKQRL